jgi:hypothetical protein
MTDVTSGTPQFPDNIDDHPAGLTLDCLLAERVLGAKVSRITEGWSGYYNRIAITPDGEEYYFELSPHSVYGPAPLWQPSTNLSDAQVLVQHLYMHSDYRTMTEEGTAEDGYSATVWAERPSDTVGTGAQPGDRPQRAESYSVTGSGPTPALALCRAVYKAARDMRPRPPDPTTQG